MSEQKTTTSKKGYVVTCIIGVVFALSGLVSDAESGDGATSLFLFVAGLSLILGVILANSSKKKQKSVKIVAGISLVLVWLMYCGALADFPYALRHMQGEEFLDMFTTFVFIAALVGAGVMILIAILRIPAVKEKAKKLIYTDGDLMLLQKFDSFKMAGYYLMKAKAHKIIICLKEDEFNEYSVKLNSDLTLKEREEYCDVNPQVKRIVAYLEAQEAAGVEMVTMRDVICHVKPQLEIQSDGGKYVTQIIADISRSLDYTVVVVVGLMYCLGLSKLMMGIYNQKQSSNLIAMLLIMIPLFLLFLCWVNSMVENHLVRKKLICALVQYKASGYRNVGQYLYDFPIENEKISETDYNYLLRAYVLNEYTRLKYERIIPNMPFTYAVFHEIVEAEKAEAAARAAQSSDSGCSGCSGCGGCGGCSGCGGCGGCGD